MDFSVDPRVQAKIEDAHNHRSQHIRGMIIRGSKWFHQPIAGTLALAVIALFVLASFTLRSPDLAHELGTVSSNDLMLQAGDLPIRNEAEPF